MSTQTLYQQLQTRGLTAADLARLVGVDKATVSRWHWRQVPAERVIQVERASGIPRQLLRPDLYPVEVAGEAA